MPLIPDSAMSAMSYAGTLYSSADRLFYNQMDNAYPQSLYAQMAQAQADNSRALRSAYLQQQLNRYAQPTTRHFDLSQYRKVVTVDAHRDQHLTARGSIMADAAIAEQLAFELARSLIADIRSSLRVETNPMDMTARASYSCYLVPASNPEHILVQEPEDVQRIREALRDAHEEARDQRAKQEALVRELAELRKLHNLMRIAAGIEDDEQEEQPED